MRGPAPRAFRGLALVMLLIGAVDCGLWLSNRLHAIAIPHPPQTTVDSYFINGVGLLIFSAYAARGLAFAVILPCALIFVDIVYWILYARSRPDALTAMAATAIAWQLLSFCLISGGLLLCLAKRTESGDGWQRGSEKGSEKGSDDEEKNEEKVSGTG